MIHVLTLLAHADQPLSSAFIAGSVNTNPVTIRKVIGELRAAGWVETLPGSSGGALLKKAPEQISLGEVYQVVREETLFGLHPSQPNPQCPVGRSIQSVLRGIFDETDRQITASLSEISIADVMQAVAEQNRTA